MLEGSFMRFRLQEYGIFNMCLVVITMTDATEKQTLATCCFSILIHLLELLVQDKIIFQLFALKNLAGRIFY